MKTCKYCESTDFYIFKSGKKACFCKEHKDYYYELREEKTKQTNLKKYGVENVFQSEIYKEKTKKTNLKKYGVEWHTQSNNFKEKANQTNLERYGAKNAFQNKDIQEKQKQTNLKKYGVENVFQSEIYKEKSRKTCLKKYGVEYESQTKKGQEKRKQTNLEKYNAENPNKNILIKNKIKNTKKDNYWETYNIKLNQKYIKPLFNKEYYINNDKIFKFKCLRCNKNFICDNTDPQKINCGCLLKRSSYEYEIENWLKNINNTITIEKNKKRLIEKNKKLELDNYLPEYNLGIDFHGLYWHSDIYKHMNDHQEKWKLFKNNNIQIIQIFENEWKSKQEIVKSIILSKLNINQTKIYARKTTIKEIDNKLYKEFLEQNHIQGYTNSKLKLGMFLDDKLISVLGLGKNRFNQIENEIIRYCSLLNHQVIGGLSKFLAYIKNNYNFDNIISYIDLRYFDGSSYLNNGFKLESITKPNYYYFKKSGNERYILYNRIQFQKHKLKNKLDKFYPNLTEYENMLNNGYLRIFDAGNYKLRLNDGK